jgi:hypothetical protein
VGHGDHAFVVTEVAILSSCVDKRMAVIND